MLKKLMLTVAAVLPLAGCINSDAPMSDPATAKTDKLLIGDWVYRGGDGRKGYLHIGDGGIGTPLRWMEVVNVKGKSAFSPTHNLGFPSVVGGRKYFNVALLKSPLEEYKVKFAEETLKEVTRYAIFKYEVSQKVLTIWEADDAVIEKAIKKGEIKGDGTTITDTSEKLRKFVAAHDAELFTADGKTKCDRLPE